MYKLDLKPLRLAGYSSDDSGRLEENFWKWFNLFFDFPGAEYADLTVIPYRCRFPRQIRLVRLFYCQPVFFECCGSLTQFKSLDDVQRYVDSSNCKLFYNECQAPYQQDFFDLHYSKYV